MLNHSLPVRGGGTWKSISAVATVAGFGVSLLCSRGEEPGEMGGSSLSSTLVGNVTCVAVSGVAVSLLFSVPTTHEMSRSLSPAFGMISFAVGSALGAFASLRNISGGGFFFMLVSTLAAMAVSAVHVHLLLCLWVRDDRNNATELVKSSHRRLLATVAAAYLGVGAAAELSAFHRFDGGGGVR